MTLLDDPVAIAAPPLTLAPAHRRWERRALLALLAATAVLYCGDAATRAVHFTVPMLRRLNRCSNESWFQ